MIWDYFRFAYKSIKKRQLRSYLTMIGIFIGIAAVVALVSLGQGLQGVVEEQFEMAGGDKIIITPGKGAAMMGGMLGTERLDDHDLDVIRKVRGIDRAGGFVTKIARIEFKKEIKYIFVIGMSEDMGLKDFGGIGIDYGRDLRDTDTYKAMIGNAVYHGNFFDKPVKIRNKIKIEDKEFEVVGVVERIGNPQDDSQFYIPLEISQELFDEEGYAMVVAKVEKGFDAGLVAEEVEEKLRKDRDLKKGDEDFSIQTYQQVMQTFGNILNAVQAIVIGIAAISLLVGGIGIMNTMYMSVLERTREIGVMKAIGAKNSHIARIFLIESGAYGLIGGVVGITIGLGLAKTTQLIVNQAFEFLMFETHISIFLIAWALLFSFAVGALSGIAPAYQASKLKPVDALRYE